MTFEDILPSVPQYDLAVIPNLFDKERQSLKNITKNPKQRNVLILIGPEGDFTPEELDLAKKAGCVSVSLGNLTFKVDTAAIALVAFLRLTMPNKNWS
jgi:16S rRNA (uracil1498-N3)-methyltransferase